MKKIIIIALFNNNLKSENFSTYYIFGLSRRKTKNKKKKTPKSIYSILELIQSKKIFVMVIASQVNLICILKVLEVIVM